MKLYSENENYKLYHGSMLDMGEVIEPNSVDAIVTDPPYELNFMNKGWDNSGIAFQKETWEKCLGVLKPGGYLLAFGGTRTFHRIAVAIEDAGFEIRDTIMWLYSSGFPKSMNLGKSVESKMLSGSANRTEFKNPDGEKIAADGWGTCLKPSYEPVIVARKPCEGSTTDNVLKYGVGGLNIDGCRIPTDDYLYQHGNSHGMVGGFSVGVFAKAEKGENASTRLGRFPSNVILTYDETDKDEVCGGMPSGGRNGSISKNYDMHNMVYGDYGKCNTFEAYEDSGSAARYFYCAKATVRDREEGCENLEDQMFHRVNSGGLENEERFKPVSRKNVHPTVKPTMLMQYLVRLVTPKGGTVLDPFNGSGSTGKGAMYENFDYGSGYKYIGIELTDTYLPIAKARIENADKTLAAEKERLSFEFSDETEVAEATGDGEDW